MPIGSTTDNQGTSTRPYLLRALHDWCTDNGFTPYIAVYVDDTVLVPREHVKNNEIVLNVGFEATSGLKLGNEAVEFRARFGGVSRDIMVPIDHVVAIYARENGQGMAFPVPTPEGSRPVGVGSPAASGATVSSLGAGSAPARGLRLAGGADAPVEEAEHSAATVLAPLSSAPARTSAGAAATEPGDVAFDQKPEPAPETTPEPPEPSAPDTPPKGPRPSLKRIK